MFFNHRTWSSSMAFFDRDLSMTKSHGDHGMFIIELQLHRQGTANYNSRIPWEIDEIDHDTMNIIVAWHLISFCVSMPLSYHYRESVSFVELPSILLLHLYLSIDPSIHLSIHLSIHPSIHPCIHASIYPSIHLSIQSIHLSIHLSCLSTIHLQIYIYSIQLTLRIKNNDIFK